MCIEDQIGDNCNSIQITFNGDNAIQQMVNRNETASIVLVQYSIQVYGKFTAMINSVYSEVFECLNLDLNSLKLSLKNDYYQLANFQALSTFTCSVYTVEGANYTNNGSLSLITGSGSNFMIQNLPYSSSFFFQILSSVPSTMDISNLVASITSGSSTKQFQLEPIGKNIFDNIYDIKTYPDIQYLSDLKTMGIESSAILSFKSNRTAITGIYNVKVNGGSTNTQTSPMYGDQNSTTYYYSLSSYGLSTFQLLYVNNGQFVDSVTIQTNIANYNWGSYPNVGLFSNAYSNSFNYVDFGFQDTKLIDFCPLFVRVDHDSQFEIEAKFPYGFSYVSPFGYRFNATVMLKSYIKSKSGNQIIINPAYGISFNSINFPFKDPIVYNTSLLPKVKSIEYFKLFDDTYLFRVGISTPYGLNLLNSLASSKIFYGKEALVSGDLYDGIYEFVQVATTDISLSIKDIYEGFLVFGSGDTVTSPLKLFTTPSYYNVDVYKIHNVSFLYNNIDVTNRRHYNVMYFNFPEGFPKDLPVQMMVIDKGYLANAAMDDIVASTDVLFPAIYDESIKMFKLEFFIEPNTQIGEFTFYLLASLRIIHSQMLDSKLIIEKSGMDFMGPVAKSIKKITTNAIIGSGSSMVGRIGWSFEIEDPVNGFDHGYVVITGQLDKSIYNISISSSDVKPGGNLYLGEYDVTLRISAPCISQNYVITEMVLYDRIARKSMFSLFPPDRTTVKFISIMNPFIYYLNDSNINTIALNCFNDPIASSDTTPPVLSSFSSSKQVIDVSATNRNVSFEFTATDLESGIKNQQTPIVYLNALNYRIIECKSSMLRINSTSAKYTCLVDLPVSFGYPGNILLSVYGLVNNNGYSSGYSTSQLLESGLQYYINTTFNTNEPSITTYYRFRNTGGDLFLNGRGFDSSSNAYLTFNDGSSTSITPIVISSTVIKIPRVRATDRQFKVYIKTSSHTSNTITVTPTIYDYYLPVPAPTFPPTVTPVPTNAPQSCPGKPECGGPSNGKCIPNQGCVCYSPWLGIDCLSQIIVVNPPIINTGNNSHGSQGSQSSDDNGSSSPTIEIIVPGAINNNTNNNGNNNNNINTKPVTYSSLISIVALREVDIYDGVVKSYTFKDNWLSRQLDTLTYAFYTIIDVGNNQQTNVTAILKWFTNQTTISFANEELTMNPSSMKYTIEIDNYPFQNSLNQLQLVMSALIQSNTTENVCSVKEFGETTQGDNSNYLKIQVDNHSLYGRFIRRGIVDSQIRTITNVQLDKDMRPITSTKSLQSYIGIQIPNYKESVIIDPDFSVILDSYSASSKSNSICSSNNKLSSGKIAGIAVGAAAFATVLGISLAYYLMKHKADKKFVEKMKRISTSSNS